MSPDGGVSPDGGGVSPDGGGVSPEVVLYGREGCCLCDEAREVLMRVRSTHPFTFRRTGHRSR